jgi:hypothetical protein
MGSLVSAKKDHRIDYKVLGKFLGCDRIVIKTIEITVKDSNRQNKTSQVGSIPHGDAINKFNNLLQ